MSKFYLIIFFCTSFYTLSFSQQVPFYNHNIINPFIYNPAQAGQSGDFNTYLVRNQRYNGFGTGAVNNYLTLDGDFFVPNSGFGLMVSNFSHGIQQQINGQFNYSYGVKFNDDNDLRFGVAVGYLENHLNNSAIDVSQLQDPYLEGLRGAAATYDFNAGLSYRFQNTRIGAAVPQLIGNQVNFQEQNNRGYYALARHFMGTIEHDFYLFEDILKIKPHGLVRYIPGAPIQYDATLHVDYLPFGWASASYRSDYAVQFNVGFRIMNSLSLGYSYEYIFGSFSNYFSGVNHEIMLGYRIPATKTKEVTDPKLSQENQQLKKEVEEKDKKLKEEEAINEELRRRLKEKLEKEKESEEEPELEPEYDIDDEEIERRESEIREDKYYNFLEMDGSKAARGYYVISGVFSEKKNLDKKLKKVKVEFPESYAVKNTVNGYYYVVINLSDSKKETFIVKDIYQDAHPEESVWMLKYSK